MAGRTGFITDVEDISVLALAQYISIRTPSISLSVHPQIATANSTQTTTLSPIPDERNRYFLLLVSTVGSILLIGLFILLGQLGAISLIMVYMWFIQGIIVGYLVAIWSFHLRTDSINRIFAGVSLFIGWQLVLGISALVLVFRKLYELSMRMGWHTSPIVLIAQLI